MIPRTRPRSSSVSVGSTLVCCLLPMASTGWLPASPPSARPLAATPRPRLALPASSSKPRPIAHATREGDFFAISKDLATGACEAAVLSVREPGWAPSRRRQRLGCPSRLLYLDRCLRAAKLAPYRDVPPNGGHPAASLEWDTWGEARTDRLQCLGVGEVSLPPHTPQRGRPSPSAPLHGRPEHAGREMLVSHRSEARVVAPLGVTASSSLSSPTPRSSVAVARCGAPAPA